MLDGASKFIAKDYFIYMTIAIAYNFDKETLLLQRVEGGILRGWSVTVTDSPRCS